MNRSDEDAARIRAAEEAQARMLAALPAFPEYGFYVKTGLAGYGPDLDTEDMPYTSWEDVASAVAYELGQCADFAFEGAGIHGDQADARYDEIAGHGRPGSDVSDAQALYSYREAWHAFKLSEELRVLALNFDNLARTDEDSANPPAPLYRGRPDLRHARIWNLITENFPLDVLDNSRLYVWECEEAPDVEEN